MRLTSNRTKLNKGGWLNSPGTWRSGDRDGLYSLLPISTHLLKKLSIKTQHKTSIFTTSKTLNHTSRNNMKKQMFFVLKQTILTFICRLSLFKIISNGWEPLKKQYITCLQTLKKPKVKEISEISKIAWDLNRKKVQ